MPSSESRMAYRLFLDGRSTVAAIEQGRGGDQNWRKEVNYAGYVPEQTKKKESIIESRSTRLPGEDRPNRRVQDPLSTRQGTLDVVIKNGYQSAIHVWNRFINSPCVKCPRQPSISSNVVNLLCVLDVAYSPGSFSLV